MGISRTANSMPLSNFQLQQNTPCNSYGFQSRNADSTDNSNYYVNEFQYLPSGKFFGSLYSHDHGDFWERPDSRYGCP